MYIITLIILKSLIALNAFSFSMLMRIINKSSHDPHCFSKRSSVINDDDDDCLYHHHNPISCTE